MLDGDGAALRAGGAGGAARPGLLVSVQSRPVVGAFPPTIAWGVGAGAFQDGFSGYVRFGDQRYLTAGTRVFSWAVQLLEERGYIPTVVGFWPYEQTEASLTYFYGLDARCAPQSERGPLIFCPFTGATLALRLTGKPAKGRSTSALVEERRRRLLAF